MSGQNYILPDQNVRDVVLVKKASGEQEPFSIKKLEASLRNAGADIVLTNEILNEINSWIYDGVTTKKIYSRAFSLLRRKKNLVASRYKLKQAIMELGPTGYPFEHFISHVFDKMGFTTKVGQFIEGYCVNHEVDVIALNEKTQYFVECKYYQSPGKPVHIQVPLYVRSRVDDIIKKRTKSSGYEGYSFYGWVVTNTRFTTESITYAKCSGLNLLSWDYPIGNGLKDIIDREKLYPITVLNQLTKRQKRELLDRGILTCHQILNEPETLSSLQLTRSKFNSLIMEIGNICS